MDDRAELLKRVERLEALLAERDQQLAEAQARIAELEERLRKQGKIVRPRRKRKPKDPSAVDRRTKGERQHPGSSRPEPKPEAITQKHECTLDHCPHCGGHELTPTGHVEEELVEDIPVPKVEVHCYLRHEYLCAGCQKKSLGRGELDVPGAQVGPRARWLVAFARGDLGISLGKTCRLLHEWFDLKLSRAGALGHLKWAAGLCAPVVHKLLEILRQEPVVHADETGWRINGKNVWAWCFANPRLAVFLIDEHRSAAVLKKALGDSLPGVLVSDFYAAYNGLACQKQRCLAHLLRELHDLAETLPRRYVTCNIRPWITLIQDALALGKRREQLSVKQFARARRELDERFYACAGRFTSNADCERITRRMLKYRAELFTFLEDPRVPPDNNLGERDIRSVAATRADGGVNRTGWGATAFARIKSVVRTCQKNGLRLVDYVMNLVRATLAKADPPLPLAPNTG